MVNWGEDIERQETKPTRYLLFIGEMAVSYTCEVNQEFWRSKLRDKTITVAHVYKMGLRPKIRLCKHIKNAVLLDYGIFTCFIVVYNKICTIGTCIEVLTGARQVKCR